MRKFNLIILILLLYFWGKSSYADNKPVLVLTQEKAQELALKRNWDVLIKEEKVKEAKAQVLKAWSAVFPQVFSFYSYQKYNEHPFINYEANRGYGFNINQIIFNAKVFNAIKAASPFLKSAKEEKKEQDNSIIFEVKKAFLQSLIAEETVKVTEDALNLAKEYLNTTKIRYSNGEASGYDVLRAKVEVKNLEYKYFKAKALFRNCLNYLKLLLGLEPKEEIKIKGKMKFIPFNKDLNELIKTALDKRPLIKAIKFKEEALKNNLRAAEAEFLPSLSLNYEDLANKKEAFAFNREAYEDYWILTFRVDFPIFEGGLRVAKLKEAKSQLEQVKLLKEKTISAVKVEIKNALLNLESARKEVEATKTNVEDAHRMYKIIYKRYLEGEASYLDILDARNTLLVSQLNYLGALFDYNLYSFQLNYLTGKNLEIKEAK